MTDMATRKRYALAAYLVANQAKTDEVLRRFTSLEEVLLSGQSEAEQLNEVRQVVTSRPDLCEYSRVQAEFGGKNSCRFMWRYFQARRAALFQILAQVEWISTSQDTAFENAIAFMLAHRKSHAEVVATHPAQGIALDDLGWIPEKWWRLVCGRSSRDEVPATINRHHFEVCVFVRLVEELKSADLCIVGSHAYADYRSELVPLAECARTKADYGEKVGLPVEREVFIEHVRGLLADAATKTDEAYPENPYFTLVNGKPKLGRHGRRPKPEGLDDVEIALSRKLDRMDLSLLDVLTDTMKWLRWGRFFGPLSGHQSKIRDEERRQILTTFTYGTGLGLAQAAKNIAEVNPRQTAFINQRHVTSEKLETAITGVINAYNKFELPRYWGETSRASADGTKWDLYENNLLSEYHIRYGSWGGLGYYHVSDTYIALFSHFIPCGVYEAIYILDGLTKNTSDIQPDTLHGDTQAQSATVYGLSFLLGIKLMPRIRDWHDLKFFKPTRKDKYRYINSLFTKEAVDWDLIGRHLPDMLQIAQSIQAGVISPSTILRRLGSASRKHKVYFAFHELGRVIRTIFLLEYLTDVELRQTIHASINKSERFNKFAQWVYFAADTIQENVRDEQIKIIKYNHLIANLLIFHNCHSMSQALKELEQEGMLLTTEIVNSLSPYRTQHVSRFGTYELRERNVPAVNYSLHFAAESPR
jgi:TnpA family transposase